MANGDRLLHRSSLGVWDAWVDELLYEDQAYILTGGKDDAQDGGIWTTGFPGGAWVEVLDAEGLGFSKHFDECGRPSSSTTP